MEDGGDISFVSFDPDTGELDLYGNYRYLFLY